MKTSIIIVFLLTSCVSPATDPGNPGTTTPTSLRYLMAIGDAAMRTEGTAALKKYAPDIFPIIDANSDDVVTMGEFTQFVAPQDPEALTWTLIVAWETYKARSKK